MRQRKEEGERGGGKRNRINLIRQETVEQQKAGPYIFLSLKEGGRGKAPGSESNDHSSSPKEGEAILPL